MGRKRGDCLGLGSRYGRITRGPPVAVIDSCGRGLWRVREGVID